MNVLLHTPQDAARAASLEIGQIRSGTTRGFPTGLGDLDHHIPGLVRPGNICFYLARPGHGKSYALRQTARVNAMRGSPWLAVEAEMSIEEVEIREASFYSGEDSADILDGRANWDAVDAALVWRQDLPVYVFGYSSLRANETRNAPAHTRRMTVANIATTIKNLSEAGVAIEGVSIDYLQLIKPHRSLGNVRQEIIEVVRDLRTLAQVYNLALFVGVQARREVDQRTPPIPRKGDGAESSEIEKAADLVVSLVYFPEYYDVGEAVPGMNNVFVRQDEILTSIVKLRRGRGNVSCVVKFRPEYAVFFSREEEWTPPYQSENTQEELYF